MTHERRQDLAIVAIIVPVLLVIAVGVADLVQLGTAQTNLNQVAQDFLDVTVQGKVVTLAYVSHGYLPLFPSRHFSASATAP